MSTGQVIWVCFCLAWFGFWMLLAFPTFGLTLIPALLSLLAILIPIGK